MKVRLTSIALLLGLVAALVITPASSAVAAKKPGSGTGTNPFIGIPVTGAVQGVTLNIVDFVNNNGALAAVVDVVNSAGQVVADNVTTPVTVQQATCEILTLELGPLDLNLLGLRIQLDRVVLEITAQQGGGLLGDLLCAVANLLNGTGGLGGLLNQLVGLLDQILGQLLGGLSGVTSGTVTGGLLNITQFTNQNGVLGVVGNVTNAAGQVLGQVAGPLAVQQATCTILDLELGPLDLNLLGLRIQLSEIDLLITAERGPGNLLGNLLCAIANLFNSPTLNLNLLTNLLNQILGVFR